MGPLGVEDNEGTVARLSAAVHQIQGSLIGIPRLLVPHDFNINVGPLHPYRRKKFCRTQRTKNWLLY
jgi:hypothetical protein